MCHVVSSFWEAEAPVRFATEANVLGGGWLQHDSGAQWRANPHGLLEIKPLGTFTPLLAGH